MVRNSLIQLLKTAVKILVEKNGFSADVQDLVEVEPPKQADHGDFATNFCLVASKQLGQNPRALAEMLVEAIRQADENQLITEIEIAGPGFINFRLSATQVANHIGTVLEHGDSFGNLENPSPERINVEFVSVNPNGPITIGSGRGAAFGSALCNVLEAAGNTVHREYYINDGVNSEQMRLFAESVKAILENTNVPSNGYKGDYVQEVAKLITTRLSRTRSIESVLSQANQFLDDFDDIFDLSELINEFHKMHTAWIKIKQDSPRTHYSHDRLSLQHKSELLKIWFGSSFSYLDKIYSVPPANPVVYLQDEVLMEKLIDSLAGTIAYRITFSNEDTSSPTTIGFYLHAYEINRQGIRDIFDKSIKNNEEWIRNISDQIKGALHGLYKTEKDDDARARQLHSFFESIADPELSTAIAVAATIDQKLLTELDVVRSLSQELMISAQNQALTRFQVNFDTWFSEQSLHDSGEVENTLQHLLVAKVADDKSYRTKVVMAKGGVIKEVLKEEQPTDEDDADGTGKTIWLRSTKFGDDQDRVLKRKDGRLTYIASDVAYHKDKFNRPANGNKLITVLGPDHHGYIARLTAVVAAMFSDQVEPLDNPEPLTEHEALIYDSVADRNQCQAALAWAKEHLQVQIFQIVRFLKDGKPAPMRKRDGNIYALIDLVNEIGAVLRPNGTEAEKQQAGSDVARFFYLMRHHDTAMDFDLELATKQSDENPVFYVQYAHARISSVIEKAKEAGFEAPKQISNPGLLNHPKEIALILKICDLPHEVERTAKDYSVNRLTTYAIELARTYHSFYDSCRVIQSDQPELTLARLALCQATRIALKNALNLLGVSAPERMDRAVSN